MCHSPRRPKSPQSGYKGEQRGRRAPSAGRRAATPNAAVLASLPLDMARSHQGIPDVAIVQNVQVHQ